MPSDYLCPRCERSYRRFWLLSGRCDDCREKLVPWLPAPLRERAAQHEAIRRVDPSDWPPLAEGVRLWSATRMDFRPTPPGDLFIELPSGEVFLLKRREQLVGVMHLDSTEDALRYTRFLYGCLDPERAVYGRPLRALTEQAPSYLELAPELRVWTSTLEIQGLDASTSRATVHEHREGDTRWFQVVRHVVRHDSLPHEIGTPQPLTGVLRLDETVFPDGRYTCEPSEPPRYAIDYRQEAARPFEGLSIVLKERYYLRGRPLQIAGAPVTSALHSDASWG